jgi:O-antigen/teichoic acid export membrane protein
MAFRLSARVDSGDGSIAMKPSLAAAFLLQLQRRTRVTAVVFYGVMTLLPQLASGTLAILYTRAFSSEEYANYGIFAAVYAFIAMLMDLGISAGMLRNFYSGRDSGREYFAAAIGSARLAMLAIVPLLGLALFFFWNAIGVRFSQKWAFIPVLLLIAYVDRSEEVLATVCRALERPIYYALGRVVHGLALIVTGYSMVFTFRLGVMGSLLALLAAEIAALIVYRIILRRKLAISPGEPDWHALRESLRFGLPLVPNRLAGWARLLAIRPMLAHVLSAGSVGVFSFASSMAAVPTLLSSGIELALGPIYYRRREDGAVHFNAKLRSFAAIYAGTLLPIWTLMILFCSDAVRVIAGRDYVQAGPICSVLLCATFVRTQLLFVTGQLQFLRKTWILPAVTIPTGLIGLIATFTLARSYGVMAAAWGVLGMDLSIFLILAWAVHRLEGLNYPIVSCLIVVTAITLLALAVTSHDLVPLWTSVGDRIAVVASAAACCAAIWIWPNRAVIHELVSR